MDLGIYSWEAERKKDLETWMGRTPQVEGATKIIGGHGSQLFV